VLLNTVLTGRDFFPLNVDARRLLAVPPVKFLALRGYITLDYPWMLGAQQRRPAPDLLPVHRRGARRPAGGAARRQRPRQEHADHDGQRVRRGGRQVLRHRGPRHYDVYDGRNLFGRKASLWPPATASKIRPATERPGATRLAGEYDAEQKGPLSLSGDITAFENGELDDDQVLDLFQALVGTGLAWLLQGSYGRTAAQLIDAWLIGVPEEGS
jgi:hypothetical protein